MLETLFAWSPSGHSQITAAAVTAAITTFIALGKTALNTKLADLGLKKVKDTAGTFGLFAKAMTAQEALVYLMQGLPGSVVLVDGHLGNIPTIGEHLEKDSQAWIRSHLLTSWQKMKDAVTKEYKIYEVFSSNLGDFNSGLSKMADALHTVEDSYAHGHVDRSAGNTNLIKDIHYWDNENKEGVPADGVLKHEDYDDPANPKNRAFYKAATDTTAELIGCVLANLDQDAATFTAALDQILSTRFSVAFGIGDFPTPSGNTKTAREIKLHLTVANVAARTRWSVVTGSHSSKVVEAMLCSDATFLTAQLLCSCP